MYYNSWFNFKNLSKQNRFKFKFLISIDIFTNQKLHYIKIKSNESNNSSFSIISDYYYFFFAIL